MRGDQPQGVQKTGQASGCLQPLPPGPNLEGVEEFGGGQYLAHLLSDLLERFQEPGGRPRLLIGVPDSGQVPGQGQKADGPITLGLGVGDEGEGDQRSPEVDGPVVDGLALQESQRRAPRGAF